MSWTAWKIGIFVFWLILVAIMIWVLYDDKRKGKNEEEDETDKT